MNTVNPDNFNQTMQGYVGYAINFMAQSLKDRGYKDNQIEDVKEYLSWGLSWAKDEMTMENARNYNK